MGTPKVRKPQTPQLFFFFFFNISSLYRVTIVLNILTFKYNLYNNVIIKCKLSVFFKFIFSFFYFLIFFFYNNQKVSIPECFAKLKSFTGAPGAPEAAALRGRMWFIFFIPFFSFFLSFVFFFSFLIFLFYLS